MTTTNYNKLITLNAEFGVLTYQVRSQMTTINGD